MNIKSAKDTREVMTHYWNKYSDEPTVVNMMLDQHADVLTKHEMPEILSYLPTLDNKDVLELGAGIGRFTSVFAENARSVIAVDFVENFIAKNKENNSRFNNIEYKCADVTQLDLERDSCDLLFSNWLLMYLEELEIQCLIEKTLSWIREDGYIFVRESCFKPAGDIVDPSIPTKYRDPMLYSNILTQTKMVADDNDSFGFRMILSRPLTSYIEMKQNENQIVWLLQKVKTSD